MRNQMCVHSTSTLAGSLVNRCNLYVKLPHPHLCSWLDWCRHHHPSFSYWPMSCSMHWESIMPFQHTTSLCNTWSSCCASSLNQYPSLLLRPAELQHTSPIGTEVVPVHQPLSHRQAVSKLTRLVLSILDQLVIEPLNPLTIQQQTNIHA